MALTTAYAQERRRGERRKEVKTLDSTSKQIITAENSSMPADELVNDFLVASA